MKRTLSLLASITALSLTLSPSAQAAATAQQKMASVQYLVGTWNCAHTVGTFSGTYTTTYSSELGNRWIRQIYDFPAQQTQENAQPMRAEFMFG
jgi:hypothetical protein